MIRRKNIPQHMDPPLPDRRRVLPGGLVLGDDDMRIRALAIENRANLETEEPFPSYFVATRENYKGNVIGTFIIQADRMMDAMAKIEEDVGGRHLWLTNGDGNHFVGLPHIAMTVNFIGLRRIRKDNCLI